MIRMTLRNIRPTRWAVVFALIGLGCGGQVDVGGGTGGGSSTSHPTGTGSDAGPPGGGSVDLPPCVKGWDPYTGDGRCPWLGSDGLCYDTKLAACACSCPRDRDSSCQSGLPGDDYSRVKVDCY